MPYCKSCVVFSSVGSSGEQKETLFTALISLTSVNSSSRVASLEPDIGDLAEIPEKED